MKRIKLIILLLSSVVVYGQLSESISFESNVHDFGVINEADGPVIHEFKFTNNAQEPISIANVKASCGCTTPAWTKDPVAPGESGFIQAQYNPRNRPGRFNKSLTITTSVGATLRLMIRGEVNPRERTPEEMYPRELGALRMKYSSLNMGKVFVNREPLTRKFDVYNQSDLPVIISSEIQSPSYLKVTFASDTIAPKSKSSFSVTYDGSLKDDLGFMNDSFQFSTNEAEDNVKTITVYTTIEEYFAPLSPKDIEMAPKLSIGGVVHDLGRIKKGETITKEVEITNIGGTILNVRKLSPNCTCLKAEITDNNINVGEAQKIKLTFVAEGRRGNQQKSLTIYSNDPRQSVQRITIKAYIEEN